MCVLRAHRATVQIFLIELSFVWLCIEANDEANKNIWTLQIFLLRTLRYVSCEFAYFSIYVLLLSQFFERLGGGVGLRSM